MLFFLDYCICAVLSWFSSPEPERDDMIRGVWYERCVIPGTESNHCEDGPAVRWWMNHLPAEFWLDGVRVPDDFSVIVVEEFDV